MSATPPAPIPTWIPDEHVNNCQVCQLPFNFVSRRKSHCRCCGSVICNDCSLSRLFLPQARTKEKVRICDNCVHTVQLQQQAIVLSPVNGVDCSAVIAPNLIANMSSSDSPTPTKTPVALPIAAAAMPVAVAATPVRPAVPVAVAAVAAPPRAAPPVAAAAPVPVQATAPRMAIPTAAAVPAAHASTSSSSSSSFFAKFADKISSKVEKHAPGFAAAVKEQIAAASINEEKERAEKKQLEAKILQASAEEAPKESQPPIAAAASALSPSPISPGVVLAAPSASSATPAIVTTPSSQLSNEIAMIPGLGPIALAAPAPGEDKSQRKKEQAVWDGLNKAEQPVSPTLQAQVSPSAYDSPSVRLRSDSGAAVANMPFLSLALPPSPATDSSELRKRGAATGKSESTSSSSASKPARSSFSVSGGDAANSAAALQSATSSSMKLDLPLRLCLVILQKTSAQMKEKYAEYRKTKENRNEGDAPLSFSQFMFFSTIRTLPDFLFKKTELAFCMMREEGDSLVFQENFTRYAPILAPLASKLDAKFVYFALQNASINSGAAMTDDQVEEENLILQENSLKKQKRPQRGKPKNDEDEDDESELIDAANNGEGIPKFKAGGIAFVQFKLYVDHLKRGELPTWPEFRLIVTPNLDKYEQLLLVRTGVTDTTSFPPHIGRVGLTTTYLLWESSLFNRKRCIRWSNITRVEKIESSSEKDRERDIFKGMKLYIVEEDASADENVAAVKRELVLSWDIPGWSSETNLLRTRTYEYIRMMIHLHKLVRSIPDRVVKNALIQETCMTLQRMRALEFVGNGCDPLLLNPFFRDGTSDQRATDGAKASLQQEDEYNAITNPSSVSSANSGAEFVSSIQASINRSENIRKSKSSWLFAILPGLQNKEEEKLTEDIDPEFAGGVQYKTMEELLKQSHNEHAPFTLKNFAHNVKLFRHQIEPVMLFIALVKRVRDWENPIVSLFTVLFLLNLSYRDYLSYLPAILVFINIVIVAVLKYYPNAVWVWLGGEANVQQDGGVHHVNAGAPIPSSAHIEEINSELELKEEAEFDAVNGPLSAPSSLSSAAASAAPASAPGGAGLVVPRVTIPTAQPVHASPPAKKEKEEEGLLAKLKNYHSVAVKTKDYLHSVQNSIGERNIQFMKVEGLYKWRSPTVTQKFFGMLVGAFLVLLFVPFRFIFPVIVLDFFTTKWQRQSSMERLLEEVALPTRMPDVD